jgi:cell division transport system permease protein
MPKKQNKYSLGDLDLAVKRKQKKNILIIYLRHHLEAAFLSLDRLVCAPISSLLTITVIAIALALPVSLEVLWQNAKNLSPNLNSGTQISLYLKKNVSAKKTADLFHKLKANSNIASVNYISAQQGLNNLQESLGIKNILLELKDNPLPATIVVMPTSKISPITIDTLLSELRKLPEIAIVQLDKAWVERLYYLVELIRRAVLTLLLLFGLGVILIVGNTTRLSMQHAHQEIKVLKLVGATDAFVRRPFLYTGIYYGLFGSLLSWLIVTISLNWLKVPIHELALSYGSDFTLNSLASDDVYALLIIGILLGLSGAWLALAEHLKET